MLPNAEFLFTILDRSPTPKKIKPKEIESNPSVKDNPGPTTNMTAIPAIVSPSPMYNNVNFSAAPSTSRTIMKPSFVEQVLRFDRRNSFVTHLKPPSPNAEFSFAEKRFE
jgi:cell division septation protein DedD